MFFSNKIGSNLVQSMDPPPYQQSFWHFMHQELQQPQLFYSSSLEETYCATEAQLNWLHNQNLLQLQQQQEQEQQQQFKMAMPQQLYDLYQNTAQPEQQQFQQQLQHETMMPTTMPHVIPAYEPGKCALILINYMHKQRNKPEDNNLEFWKDFVSQFFAPDGTKKLCLSMHESGKKKTRDPVFSVWKCGICNQHSGHGFEIPFETLPKLFKVKYDGGIVEELLHVDKHREYIDSSGQIVLECMKVTTETVSKRFRVLHHGSLKIVFSPSDLKICSFEFCVKDHEVFMIRRPIASLINELGSVVQNCEALAESEKSGNNISTAELQKNCDKMAASAKHLGETLQVPLDNDYGYPKIYVRFLEISQAAETLKDLIDFSTEKRIGPIESLMKFSKMKLHQQQQKMGSRIGGDQNIEQAGSNTTTRSIG